MHVPDISRSSETTDQLSSLALRRNCKRNWKRLLPRQGNRTPEQLQSRWKRFVVALKATSCKNNSPIYSKSLEIMAVAWGEYHILLCVYRVNLKNFLNMFKLPEHLFKVLTINEHFFHHLFNCQKHVFKLQIARFY